MTCTFNSADLLLMVAFLLYVLVATSKAGGGTQGREVKSKAVKNKFKGRGGAARDSDDEDTPTTSHSYGPKVR